MIGHGHHGNQDWTKSPLVFALHAELIDALKDSVVYQ
jgi:hypothetical protein